GGMLTNFPTIRKAVKKMASIDKMAADGTFDNLSKREKLQIARQRAKLEKNLGSIADLSRLPAAIFVVDILKEHIAVKEARRLNIPVFAMVDTNSDPNLVDFPIPANDDASKSIALIVDAICSAIEEGLSERKIEKDTEPEKSEKGKTARKKTPAPESVAEEEAEEMEEVTDEIEEEEEESEEETEEVEITDEETEQEEDASEEPESPSLPDDESSDVTPARKTRSQKK
ncbi:MAG TPA: 30S ribosomal protein S2, partial [Bacteroidales bacterium]|nr:30S ribosomal protein S2 [Bacteroidales bacterium]